MRIFKNIYSNAIKFNRKTFINNIDRKMDEVAKAQKLDKGEENTLFHKILRKEIPSTCVFENDKIYAFRDINPQAAVHVIIIPKDMSGLNMLENANENHVETLGYLMLGAKLTAEKLGLSNGYRVVINNGKHGCQSVNYIHIHLLGGQQLGWPPC